MHFSFRCQKYSRTNLWPERKFSLAELSFCSSHGDFQSPRRIQILSRPGSRCRPWLGKPFSGIWCSSITPHYPAGLREVPAEVSALILALGCEFFVAPSWARLLVLPGLVYLSAHECTGGPVVMFCLRLCLQGAGMPAMPHHLLGVELPYSPIGRLSQIAFYSCICAHVLSWPHAQRGPFALALGVASTPLPPIWPVFFF